MSDLRCPYCGGEIDELTVFCRHCKKNVRKAQPVTEQASVMTEQVTRQAQQQRAPTWLIWAILSLVVVVIIWSNSSGSRSSSTETMPTMASGLRGAIEAALGEGNRPVERISRFSNSSSATGQVYVEFAINDNLSEGLIVGGAQLDCTAILKAVARSDASYGSVRIVGTFSLKDAFGNVEETEVVRLDFDAATVRKINWNGFSYKDIYTIADSADVHPQFRP